MKIEPVENIKPIPVEEILKIIQAQLEVLKNLTTTFVYIPSGIDIEKVRK